MNIPNESVWSPREYTLFKALIVVRLLAALLSNISDCDETYNYWEPLHMLLYGDGFQTWEYSPLYALRSYVYVGIHTVFAYAIMSLSPIYGTTSKVSVFYGIRIMLALICASIEVRFYTSIKTCFNASIANFTALFLLFSHGMFIAATALLPSSFAMYFCTLAFAYWFEEKWFRSVLCIAFASIVGWPFAAALGIPIAINLLLKGRLGLLRLILWTLLLGFLIGGCSLIIDSYFYGRHVIAALNILLYNVFGSAGPDLYGTEPISYYVKNCLLNFNLAFPLAMCALVTSFALVLTDSVRSGITVGRVAIERRSALWQQWLTIMMTLSPLYIWVLIFFTRPHKEERFLFPIYPILCLAAAVGLYSTDILAKAVLMRALRPRKGKTISRFIICTVFIVYALLCTSRSVALYTNYGAPLEIYRHLYVDELKSGEISQLFEKPLTLEQPVQVRVCVGKEWYRFPSSFFLPSTEAIHVEMRFVQSDFRGQLPGRFPNIWNATRVLPIHANDRNKEEPFHYVPVSSCHYLVDVDIESGSELEPRYALDTANWAVVTCEPFLDASIAPLNLRTFWIPLLTNVDEFFHPYCLLRNNMNLLPLKTESLVTD